MGSEQTHFVRCCTVRPNCSVALYRSAHTPRRQKERGDTGARNQIRLRRRLYWPVSKTRHLHRNWWWFSTAVASRTSRTPSRNYSARCASTTRPFATPLEPELSEAQPPRCHRVNRRYRGTSARNLLHWNVLVESITLGSPATTECVLFARQPLGAGGGVAHLRDDVVQHVM